MVKSHLLLLSYGAILLALGSACKKDYDLPASSVEGYKKLSTHFIWNEDEKIPLVLKLKVYDEYQKLFTSMIIPSEGIVLSLPQGQYNFIAYSIECPNIQFNESATFDSEVAYLKSAKQPNATSKVLTENPTKLWSWSSRETIHLQSDTSITAPVKQRILKYNVFIPIKPSKAIKSSHLFLDQISDYFRLSDNRVEAHEAIAEFNPVWGKLGSTTGLWAELSTLNEITESTIYFAILTPDNKVHRYQYKVPDQVQNQDTICVPEVVLDYDGPIIEDQNEGFIPEIDQWINDNVYVTLG